jgi:hypothetical protein
MEEEEIVKGAQLIGAVLKVLASAVVLGLAALAVWMWARS